MKTKLFVLAFILAMVLPMMSVKAQVNKYCDAQLVSDSAALEAYKPGLEAALRSFGFTPIITDPASLDSRFGCPTTWLVKLAEIPSWGGNTLVIGLIDGSVGGGSLGSDTSPEGLAKGFISQAKGTLLIPFDVCYGTGNSGCVSGDLNYTWSTIQKQLATCPGACVYNPNDGYTFPGTDIGVYPGSEAEQTLKAGGVIPRPGYEVYYDPLNRYGSTGPGGAYDGKSFSQLPLTYQQKITAAKTAMFEAGRLAALAISTDAKREKFAQLAQWELGVSDADLSNPQWVWTHYSTLSPMSPLRDQLDALFMEINTSPLSWAFSPTAAVGAPQYIWSANLAAAKQIKSPAAGKSQVSNLGAWYTNYSPTEAEVDTWIASFKTAYTALKTTSSVPSSTPGCTSAGAFSITTGKPCVTTSSEPGCTSAGPYNTMTGKLCGTSIVPGCIPGYLFSPLSGNSCSGAQPNIGTQGLKLTQN